MNKPGRHALGALFISILVFGPGVTLHRGAADTIAAALPAPMILELAFSKAHAGGTKRSRRRARRKAAEREAAQKQREEYEKTLLGTATSEMPAGCPYDSYASIINSSEIYSCGGNYYQKYEEDGVAGFVGHPVGMDREEIKRARARRAEAEEKRKAEAEKKRKEDTKEFLSSDCAYDSYASFAAESNVYSCGGVQFTEFKENGVTGYIRGTAASAGANAQRAAGRPKAENQRQAAAGKKPQAPRLTTLPKGCTYDTHASFFTSSNVYSCNGVRYRQVQEKGITGYEVLDL